MVVSFSYETAAGEILCSHMRKQARSASLPFPTFDAPHVTLVTQQLTTKRNTSGTNKQQTASANHTGYERNTGEHTGDSVIQSSHLQNLTDTKRT